jgi:hypothetical protein
LTGCSMNISKKLSFITAQICSEEIGVP